MIYYLTSTYIHCWNTSKSIYSYTINCAPILSSHYNDQGQLVVRYRTPDQSMFVSQEVIFAKDHNTTKKGNRTLNYHKIDEWISTLNITKINIPHLSNKYPEIMI